MRTIITTTISKEGLAKLIQSSTLLTSGPVFELRKKFPGYSLFIRPLPDNTERGLDSDVTAMLLVVRDEREANKIFLASREITLHIASYVGINIRTPLTVMLDLSKLLEALDSYVKVKLSVEDKLNEEPRWVSFAPEND